MLNFFYRLLACWTHQKVKCDSDSAPFTLEDLSDALSVEDMIAGKPHARIVHQLTSPADVAKVILVGQVDLCILFRAGPSVGRDKHVLFDKHVLQQFLFFLVLFSFCCVFGLLVLLLDTARLEAR